MWMGASRSVRIAFLVNFPSAPARTTYRDTDVLPASRSLEARVYLSVLRDYDSISE